MIPISMMSQGDEMTIQKITGDDAVRQHLAELGFVVGAQVRVVSRQNENMILSVFESRVALDRSMTSRVMV